MYGGWPETAEERKAFQKEMSAAQYCISVLRAQLDDLKRKYELASRGIQDPAQDTTEL